MSMDEEQKIAWNGNVHVYNGLSEFYLYQDVHSLSSLAQGLMSTQYAPYAKEIIELIHLEDKRIHTDNEIKVLKDNPLLYAHLYSTITPETLYVYYKNSGYQLDGFEADHLGIMLKFLSLLCIDTLENDDFEKFGIVELRYLFNDFDWLEEILKQDLCKNYELPLLEVTLKLTMTYLHDHRKFLERNIRKSLKDLNHVE